MKGKPFRPYLLAAVLVVLLLLPHLFFFNNGYVDVEPYYVQSASDIAEHGAQANLSEYFTRIANPALTSLILSASYKLFGESPAISRMTIFLLSFLFSIFLYFYLKKKEGVFIAFVSSLLVIVNPFFIVYSQYVMSDAPFLAFSSVSLLLLLYASSSKSEIVSSATLGISLATKYVAVILFPVVFIYSLLKNKVMTQFTKTRLLSVVRFNLWYFALTLLVSVPVVVIAFNFISSLRSPKYESTIVLDASSFLPHLFAYLLWLGLFIGPFFLIFVLDLWKRIGTIKSLTLIVGLVAFTLIVSLFFPISTLHVQQGYFGEMNLSWLESVVPAPYLSIALFLVLLVAEFFVAHLTLDLMQTTDNKARTLFFWIIIPIVLMSFTRAANRYLLTILVPLSLYGALVAKRVFSGHARDFVIIVLVIHALIFVSVGFYSNYYLQQRGLAASIEIQK
ncbi:MAG: phospholipid carrier-dependent glycosyltransferase [Chloroflexota bacterium]